MFTCAHRYQGPQMYALHRFQPTPRALRNSPLMLAGTRHGVGVSQHGQRPAEEEDAERPGFLIESSPFLGHAGLQNGSWNIQPRNDWLLGDRD